VLVVLGLAVILALGFLAYGRFLKTTPAPASLVTTLSETITLKDSDHDGLKDWEETLWSTNAAVADTDGDGTTDGEEVAQGRNPSLKGPDDKLDTKALAARVQTSAEALSPTDRFAREFFTEYLSLKQNSDEPLTESDKIALIETTLKRAAAQDTTPTPLTVKTTSDNSAGAIKTYANAVAQALLSSGALQGPNEAAVLQQSLATEDRGAIVKLDTNILAYQKTVAAVAGTPTPSSLAPLARTFLASLQQLTTMIIAMRGVYEDPLAALVAVGDYPKRVDAFSAGLRSIRLSVEGRAVFETADPWYTLMHFNTKTQ